MDNIDDEFDEFYQKSHYRIVRVLLSSIGLWPCHTLSRRCTIYLVLLLIIGFGIMFQMLGTIEIRHDTFKMIDCLPFTFLSCVSTFKLLNAIYTLPEITILLQKMRKYYLSLKSKEETNILHSYTQYGRIMGQVYTGIVFGHCSLYVCLTPLNKFLNAESNANNTLQNNQVGLPFHVNYMVDFDTYYVPILIHVSACVIFYSIIIITFDVLYLTLVQHCCAQFAALRYRLEHADEVKDEDSQQMHTKDKIHLNLVYSFRRHTEVIQLIAVMETVYKLPFFLHVVAKVSVLSLLGYQILMHKENTADMVRHGTYFSVLIISTLFENWQGQKIIDSSEKVFNSAYNTKWYKMSKEHRKFLIIVMILSSKSLKLTAGNIFVLSYVNFNAVVRASSSYFMLLRSIQ